MNAQPNTELVWSGFSDYIRNFVQTKVDRFEDVEDLVQDTFVKIHTKLPELKDVNKLTPWVFAITRNVINDYYRTKGREFNEEEWGHQLHQPEYREMLECIRPMIEELPEPYVSALIWSELEGKKQVDLAKKEGISVSAAKSRVQRGRQLLKQQLKDCCNFELNEHGQIKEGWQEDNCNFCDS